ncbi:MAG: hypothetical protein JNL32_04045 [Candidatus Kapabacteria bacterium]|nr:hypothetical protein [Candidatus Kapabacteria bacterium]
MKTFTIAACAAIMLTLTSCEMLRNTDTVTQSTVSPKPVTLSTEYYPLAIGNEWHFVPDTNIRYVAPYDGHIVRVTAERTIGTVKEYDITDSILDIERTVDRYVLMKEGSKVWRVDAHGSMDIRWLIDFNATAATPGKDFYGFVQDKSDDHTVTAGTFKNALQVFFPAAAYDGMPVIVFAQGIGPLRYINFGGPTELKRAVIDGKVYGK